MGCDMVTTGYRKAAALGTSEYVDKKSKFLGFCYPVADETEAQALINQYEKKYHDATHVVYAYQIGAQDEKMRSTDDGEPSGTAGRPILELLKQEGLHDTLVIVVRYFGGTLLGTGGLVRAYSKCAALAMDAAGQAEVVAGVEVALSFPYDCLDAIQRKCNEYECEQINVSYTDTVSLQIRCSVSAWTFLQRDLQAMGQGSIHLMILDDHCNMVKKQCLGV